MVTYGSNKSFVLRGIEDVVYEERPVPELADDEVLIEVKKTGICGSDVHYLHHGRIGDFVVKDPMVLGHESAGIVFQVGKGVKNLKVGQKVAVEPGQTCRKCHACKSGKYELCPDIIFAATPPYDGTLGRYYKVPEDLAYPLPDNLDLEDGAMMEPLSVAIHSASTISQIKANQVVAVFGAGPVGLLCMAVARALGARRVIAIDINEARLQFAKTYAATDIHVPSKPKEGESRMEYSRRNADEIRAAFGLEERGINGVDTVLEATGAEVCIQTGIFLAKVGGAFTQIGMGTENANIPITMVLVKELQFRGSFRYGYGDYPLAISFVAQGKIDLKPLITHTYSFDSAVEAFEATKSGVGKDGKPVIKAVINGPL